MGYFLIGLLVVITFSMGNIIEEANCEIPHTVLSKIERMNSKGPYLGIVAPNNYELNPLLTSQAYVPDPFLPFIDFAGRRFRFGKVSNQKVVIVMCGLGMVNSGISTQLLVSLFKLKGVLHYGIAGNADVNLQIGDVTIPKFWAHSGLWNWQRFGDGTDNELALESGGDYTREIGYIQFSKYSNQADNLLNRIWYQPEEIFPVTGTPEVREHIFWVPVDKSYLDLARQLEYAVNLGFVLDLKSKNESEEEQYKYIKPKSEAEGYALSAVIKYLQVQKSWLSTEKKDKKLRSCKGKGVYVYDLPSKFNRDLLVGCVHMVPWTNMHLPMDTKLPQCVNTTCLPRPPKVTIVDHGMSASVFVDNAAYRTFLRSKFNATAIEMESAAVALICHEQNIPFIVIRALSDLAGGGSDVSNEATIFGDLAAHNSVDVLVKFIGLLSPQGRKFASE